MADWYAVEQDVARTGRTQILYVQADSGQAAVSAYPGGTLLGGPYASEAAAEKAHPQGSSGSTADAAGLPPPTTDLTPSDPLPGLAQIGDFFDTLTQASTWERVGLWVLGAVFVIIGASALLADVELKDTPIAPIAQTAATVAKAVK
jgi:hypothetical protein